MRKNLKILIFNRCIEASSLQSNKKKMKWYDGVWKQRLIPMMKKYKFSFSFFYFLFAKTVMWMLKIDKDFFCAACF